jgi:hypothetical protein
MKNMLQPRAFTFFLLFALAATLCTSCEKRLESLRSTSPNGRYLVVISEKEGLDRNFDVILTDLRAGSHRIIFSSPDEGRPSGTERIFWSSNSAGFLLAGRHFYVDDHIRLPDGTDAYLLFDISKAMLRCNASQAQYSKFGMKDISQLGILP